MSFEAALDGATCDRCTEPRPRQAPADPRVMPSASICPCVDVTLDFAASGPRARLAEARGISGQPAVIPAQREPIAAGTAMRPDPDALQSAGLLAAGPVLVGSVVLLV